MVGSKKLRNWLLLVGAAGILWLGWRLWDVRSTRRAIAEAEVAMRAGRFGLAVQRLSALLARKPGTDQAAYLLGVCEKSRGKPKEAFEAWGAIPLDSAYAGRAVLARMDLLVQQGALAEAENVIEQALEAQRSGQSGIAMLLVLVYKEQGRFEDARRYIEVIWEGLDASGEGASEQAINLVRTYVELDSSAPMTESVQSYIKQASELQPQDDRVWLGKAGLAIQARSFDEAARWLTACLWRRPGDVSVWRSKLRLAMATNRLADVHEALAHIPAREWHSAQVHKMAAWLAAGRHNLELEKQELASSLADDPADLPTLDRLIEFAGKDGLAERAAGLRLQKAELQRVEARYRTLYERNQPSRDSVAMARLAEQLGRWFEARVFLATAIADEPNRSDLRSELARVAARGGATTEKGRTLADILAPALGSAAQPVSRANPSPPRRAPYSLSASAANDSETPRFVRYNDLSSQSIR